MKQLFGAHTPGESRAFSPGPRNFPVRHTARRRDSNCCSTPSTPLAFPSATEETEGSDPLPSTGEWSDRVWVIVAEGGAGAAPDCSDLAKLATLNETDEFVPLGMRQANDVLILADCHALVGNLDLRASSASRA